MTPLSRTRSIPRAIGKTISAQPSVELSGRIEGIQQLANQTTAQVVLEAVDCWTHLPPEAHDALRRQEAAGGIHTICGLMARIRDERLSTSQHATE
jgi:hypothetical protein